VQKDNSGKAGISFKGDQVSITEFKRENAADWSKGGHREKSTGKKVETVEPQTPPSHKRRVTV